MSRNTCDWKDDRCPRCFSFDIEHEGMTHNNPYTLDGLCNNCGLAFFRFYKNNEYDSTEWDAIQLDKRHGEITPWMISSNVKISLDDFKKSKYDPVERNKKRYEEYLRMEEQIFEQAAQMDIWWIPFKRRVGWKWWKRENFFVIVDTVMVHKDGTYHKVECREELLKAHLKAFIRVRRKNEN